MSATLLLLAASLAARCDLRSMSFENGFQARLPAHVCVTRTDIADFTIFHFADRGGRVFLDAYAGDAANFPYFAANGSDVASSACSKLHIEEHEHGAVTHVGGSARTPEGRCGEMLVRRPASAGTIGSAAVHFWYSRLTADEERRALVIIDAVVPAK